jgi:hypothetical protein
MADVASSAGRRERSEAFDGGAVVAVELAQIDLADDLGPRAACRRIAAPIVG